MSMLVEAVAQELRDSIDFVHAPGDYNALSGIATRSTPSAHWAGVTVRPHPPDGEWAVSVRLYTHNSAPSSSSCSKISLNDNLDEHGRADWAAIAAAEIARMLDVEPVDMRDTQSSEVAG